MKYSVYQPSLTGNEKKYVNECLDTTWISSKGKFISEFEHKFADYIGIKYATGTCNGTVPIHIALLALGIGAGDEVIVPSFTYIASANPIVICGAVPVFADSLPDTLQVDPQDIERKITPKTKAIMVAHLYGHPADMDRILSIAKKHNLFVIEDTAEAFGAKYKGRYVGTFGDISTFSFFGNKTITCGEGGMAVTNNPDLYEKLTHLKGQGLAKNREYWHDIIGFNYRITNIAAAIGLAQLEQADKFIAQKRQAADWYYEELKDIPGLKMLRENGDVINSYWMITFVCETSEKRDGLRNYMKEQGIETRPTFYPIHTMPMYKQMGYKLPVAEDIALRGMNVPSYPALTHDDVAAICSVIRKYYGK